MTTDPIATLITANITIPGLHHWPHAHHARAYLRSPHRHLFHIAVTVDVDHNERDIEFHDLAEHVRKIVLNNIAQKVQDDLAHFGTRSCEALAQELGNHLTDMDVPVRKITWSEDGEFTAELHY